MSPHSLKRKHPTIFHSTVILFLAVLHQASLPAHSLERPDLLPEEVEIIEHLNSKVGLSLEFTDAAENKLVLEKFLLPNRPNIIIPAYFECPQLCTWILNGAVQLINSLDLVLGEDYNIITVSIDPRESAELAAEKSKNYYRELRTPNGPKGWHFLTGSKENIEALMAQLGFKYKKDGNEWAHTAAIMLLTPDGRLARYFYGVEFPSKDVRYALVEAGQGRIGNTLDKVFLYCFRFDPTKGKYTPVVWRLTQVVCGAGVALLGMLLVGMRLQERRKRKHV